MNARRALWVTVREVLRFLFLLGGRLRVYGQRNVPEQGAVLLVSNHQSYLDPIVAGIGIDRSVTYMARKSLFRNPFFGQLISWLNAFPVDLQGRDVSALREAVERLRGGWCGLIFAEGTRSSDGEIAPLRSGAMVIAERSDATIVPVVVDGAFEAWPKGGRLRLHPIRVAYGRPLTPAERGKMTREETLTHIRNEMLALQAKLRRMR